MAGSPGGIPARLRAAQAFAGLDNPELARRLHVSPETLSRMKNGKSTADGDMRERWAAETGVPPAFMEVGFGPLERPMTDVERRLHQAEEAIARLEGTIAELAARDGHAVDGAVTPSVTERARAAARRLAGTPEASPGTGGARDAGGEAT